MSVRCTYNSVIEIVIGMNQTEHTAITISIVRPKDLVHDQNNARSRGAVIRWRFTLLIMRSMSIKLNKLHILLTTWVCHDELLYNDSITVI